MLEIPGQREICDYCNMNITCKIIFKNELQKLLKRSEKKNRFHVLFDTL